MEVVIDFRNYAQWYNTIVLLLVSGTTVLIWAWTIRGLATLVHGPQGHLEKLFRGTLYGGTAVFVLIWVFYSIMLTSHHLTGWPDIHIGNPIDVLFG